MTPDPGSDITHITELQRERFKRQASLSPEELLLCALYDVRNNTVTEHNYRADKMVMLIITEDTNEAVQTQSYSSQCTLGEFVAYSHILLDSAVSLLKGE